MWVESGRNWDLLFLCQFQFSSGKFCKFASDWSSFYSVAFTQSKFSYSITEFLVLEKLICKKKVTFVSNLPFLFIGKKEYLHLDGFIFRESLQLAAWNFLILFSSVQFSWVSHVRLFETHGLQYAWPPCLWLTPRAYSNSCPLSWWCHPTISSSVIPFSSHPQSFPASGSFQTSQFFASGGQSIGVSASASVLPMNIQDWFPLGWTDWISLQSKGLSRVFPNTTVQKHQFFGTQLPLWSNSHIHTL